uniref:Uncharacterized protein n=1 Tax=Candidatus Kentrum sp. LPFa TaxID=2126335 RepID=A0A450WYB1_9GAMM|nr:MAG: hypothetical protein BECKLPF1236A_GA0070988_103293 [Candidatus Kentron sp. LPFa]VFK26310.1 MAG: hypothetical protein BECKLPF1236C_GA0070990_1003319 [Candidatus Kentron sp. LPFa]
MGVAPLVRFQGQLLSLQVQLRPQQAIDPLLILPGLEGRAALQGQERKSRAITETGIVSVHVAVQIEHPVLTEQGLNGFLVVRVQPVQGVMAEDDPDPGVADGLKTRLHQHLAGGEIPLVGLTLR